MENSDLEETLILAFASMIVFLSEATDCFKRCGTNDPSNKMGLMALRNKADKVSSKLHKARLRADQAIGFFIAAWDTIQEQFGKMIKQVQRQMTRRNERAQARALQSSQPNFRESDGRFNRNLSLARSQSDHPRFSCNNIPWPKDPTFHGRDSILAEVQKQ